MRRKLKTFWGNPWTVAIGSGLVLSLLSVIIDVINKERLFSTIIRVFLAIWAAVIIFLNFELKVWWVLIGVSVLFLALYLWAKYLDLKQSAQREPEFTKYTQDMILGYKWKWSWEKNYYDGKYRIGNLHPICEKCDTPLTYSNNGCGRLTCLRCQQIYWKELPAFDNVKMMISDNVRRKYFPNE